jgi:D-alanine-D-alanine ligase
MIVGVLRGGPSSEYNLSLKSGAMMLNALPEDEFETRDIFVDKRGVWHLRGIPSTPARALAQIDVVLNAMHGGVGEDGTVGRLLNRAGVPYAGSRPLSSSVALNKMRTHEMMSDANIRMPRAYAFTMGNNLNTGEMAQRVFSKIGPPYMVKPPSEGAAYGIRYVPTLVELPDAIGDVMDAYGAALVEEYIRGRQASVGLLEHFRGEDLYAFPPVEVRYAGRHVESDMHENALLDHLVPSRFSESEKRGLMDTARMAHRVLGLSHFSRADLIVAPHGVYLLEINSIPGLYPGASYPLMLESVGSSVPEFLKHSINLARAI